MQGVSTDTARHTSWFGHGLHAQLSRCAYTGKFEVWDHKRLGCAKLPLSLPQDILRETWHANLSMSAPRLQSQSMDRHAFSDALELQQQTSIIIYEHDARGYQSIHPCRLCARFGY
eukprot:914471-Pleurochrysis_carterae.AAC.2